jgi:hypothetical protein
MCFISRVKASMQIDAKLGADVRTPDGPATARARRTTPDDGDDDDGEELTMDDEDTSPILVGSFKLVKSRDGFQTALYALSNASSLSSISSFPPPPPSSPSSVRLFKAASRPAIKA